MAGDLNALNEEEEWEKPVPVRDLGSEMREYLSISGSLERGMCMRSLFGIVVVMINGKNTFFEKLK